MKLGSLVRPMLALVVVAQPAVAASTKEPDLRADCQSANVPADQLADCVAAMKECMKSKTLKQCEAEILNPNEGTPD